jgi:hypothetical protein
MPGSQQRSGTSPYRRCRWDRMCGYGFPRIFHLRLILVDQRTVTRLTRRLSKGLVHRKATRIHRRMSFALYHGWLTGLEFLKSRILSNLPDDRLINR